MSAHRPGAAAGIVVCYSWRYRRRTLRTREVDQFVAVVGQTEPVPGQWLQDEEARVAHNMKLPEQLSRREAA